MGPFERIKNALLQEPVPRTRVSGVILAATATPLPISILIAQNYGEVTLLRPILEISLIVATVAGVTAWVLGRIIAPHLAGIICAVLGYVFFSMTWAGSNSTPSLLAAWISVGLLASVVIAWLIGNSAKLLALAAVVTTIGSIGSLLFAAAVAEESITNVGPLAFTDEFQRTPNVYIFVLDGFSNPRVIEEQLGDDLANLDFSPHVENLELLGFDWEENARTNYPETRLSVPSMLNTEWPLLPGDESNPKARLDGRAAMSGENRLVELFTQSGYEYWHSGSGLWGDAKCDPDIADRCIGDAEINYEALSAVWGNTPLKTVLGPKATNAQDPEKVVAGIAEARASGSIGPYLMFSHMILPHHPYRFDRDCNTIASTSNLVSGATSEFRSEYAGQALCTMQMLERSMAQLVEMDPDAVILLQADHGSPFLSFGEESPWTDDAIRERMDIFRMTRLPDDCRHEGIAAQSLINTGPLLQACMTQTEPEFVEPRLIITNYRSLLYETEHPDDQTNSPPE